MDRCLMKFAKSTLLLSAIHRLSSGWSRENQFLVVEYPPHVQFAGIDCRFDGAT